MILSDDLITIGIPTFERPELLQRILKCATNQTYQNLEIIISDNASINQEVKNIADQFCITDYRVQYFRQEKNIGVLENVDFLIKKSKGKFFTIFSDDDWRSPEFIELLKIKLDQSPEIKFAFSDYAEVNEDGLRAPGYPRSHLRFFREFSGQKKLYRLIAYYWQNAKKGKPNLFYALFRLDELKKINLKKISGNFTYLNMDCLMSYSMLRVSPLGVVPELMCTLTCGNIKHYENTYRNYSGGLSLKRVKNFFTYHWEDRKRYVSISDSWIERLLINLLFPIKLFNLVLESFLEKVKLLKLFLKTRHDLSPSLKKIRLPQVTLVAMASKEVEETVEALKFSSRGIEFAEVKLLSHYTPFNIDCSIKFHRIQKNKDVAEWGKKIIYDLHKYINTEFIVLVHADGFVVNPEMWQANFLNYDYIGAPWPLPSDNFSFRDVNGDIVRVGNSVSLRSKRILELPSRLGIPWESDHGFFHEDGFLCVKNRHILIKHGIKFAPLEVAKYFSHETMMPEIKNIKPFAFHKWAGTNANYPKFN